MQRLPRVVSVITARAWRAVLRDAAENGVTDPVLPRLQDGVAARASYCRSCLKERVGV